jgi:excinuclease ABC subunit A
LDEPTTGLHFEDIRVLMGVINTLVDKGNTILIIEHNMDVIKLADYIIDIGPEGGRRWKSRSQRNSRIGNSYKVLKRN